MKTIVNITFYKLNKEFSTYEVLHVYEINKNFFLTINLN